MANQSPDRRQVLEMIAKAAIASQFPGFSRWVFAQGHQHGASHPAQLRPMNYKPQFFSPGEYAAIERLTEIIIPKDESPGAKEAGVSEFIDFMAAHGEEDLQQPFKEGLAWIDKKAETDGGKSFVDLTPDKQTALLKSVAYKALTKPEDVQGHIFFQTLRRYTVMGYYTSRVGFEELDSPELKFYSASPECPHKDDPEHKHLPPPRF